MNKSHDELLSIPDDILFPDELSRFLREKVTFLLHENGALQKELSTKEEICNKLQVQIDKLKKKESVSGDVLPQFLNNSSHQTVQSKIIELSKNYREKCAELEKYKTNYSKLLHNFEILQKRDQEEPHTKLSQENIKQQEVAAKSELKQLQDKLNTTTNKMLEFKNANMQLRNELKQANKLLQQEIGEDLDTLQSKSNWKGRAQIICDLQDKNKKLREKIKNMEELTAPSEVSVNPDKYSTKIQQLEKELAEAKSTKDVYKTKFEALKSRCSLIEIERHELKSKMINAEEENFKNEQKVTDLTNQLSEAENRRKCVIKEKEREIGKLKMETSHFLEQIEKYKVIVNNLRGSPSQASNKMEPIEPKVNNVDINSQMLHLQEEKGKLLDLLNAQNKRLETERNEYEKCQKSLLMEKQKNIKLETAVTKNELESLATHRSRYSSVSDITKTSESNNLRDQLELAEENIKALRARLEMEKRERKSDFEEFLKIVKLCKQK